MRLTDLVASIRARTPRALKRRFDDLAATNHTCADQLEMERRRSDDLERQLNDLAERHHPLAYARAEAERLGAAPFLDWAPPGHFYSPLPALVEMEQDGLGHGQAPLPTTLPGLSLNRDGQLGFLETLRAHHDQYEVASEPGGGRRHFTPNGSYDIGDTIVLGGMLRHFEPGQIIEVGSGHSSCAILDTVDAHFTHDVSITVVDPYTERLESLLLPGDADRLEIIGAPVQSVPIDRFEALEDSDLLFIDSSHVVKLGSDVLYEILDVLPSLQPGVVVHLHDIFWPFDYPMRWVEEGRAWSEAYLLRAFLTLNDDFEILFFNDYMHKTALDELVQHLPKTRDSPGGAIWLRRK